MQSSLNLRVKFRESFRPFAPAVLREDVADWFELDSDSPYMQIVADVLAKRAAGRKPGDDRAVRHRHASTFPAPRSRPSPMSTIRRGSKPFMPDTNARFHALLTASRRRRVARFW